MILKLKNKKKKRQYEPGAIISAKIKNTVYINTYNY